MDFSIELLEVEDLDHVMAMLGKIFEGHDTMASDPIMTELHTQLDVSYKAVMNGEIIGCYLMNEDSIYCDEDCIISEDLTPYNRKDGIHGVAIALRPEFRGRGYGRKLLELPRKMGYEYVWGFNAKNLDNIDAWIRYGRRIIGESETCYITLMDL
jgi:GNAT superfamily N-acetyltransferase